ncbi:hypothetical protein BC829DRAFT_392160 [Chytridium lagenaria]|nr:hypothetical protein BC829DRAFT_392160 [Chytridium lagenaria]
MIRAQPQITLPIVSTGVDGSKASLQSRRGGAKILDMGIFGQQVEFTCSTERNVRVVTGIRHVHAYQHVPTSDRKMSQGSFISRKVHPSDTPSIDYVDGQPRSSFLGGGSLTNGEVTVQGYEDEEDDGLPRFTAVPSWAMKYVRPRTAAMICFVITFGLALTVIVYDFAMLAKGKSS